LGRLFDESEPAAAQQVAALDEVALRERARDALQNGRLPRRRPDRALGGPGSGEPCFLCGVVLRRDGVELEAVFTQPTADAIRYHLHPRCLAAWELEIPAQTA
jgi:hypothetical protein